MTRAFIFLVRCYQMLLRPHLIGSCKYCPTCSDYAIQALQTHGSLRGSYLAARRLLRCHPLAPGGLDLVPPRPPHGR